MVNPELRARVAAIRDETKRQHDLADEAWLRKSIVEHLLTVERGPSLIAPGWIVEAADITHDMGPGTIVTVKGPIKPPQRLPSPLFQLADDLVAYVLTGKHPSGEMP